MKSAEVIVVGGGVIGLSIAHVLAREGIRATVLDRGEPGRAASWAGAGMIPPHIERLATNPTIELRSWSAVLYPEWSQELLESTGIDNGYRRTGGVDVAFTEGEEQELKTSAGRWRAERIVYERITPGDFDRIEPALNPELRLAYFLPDRAQIRNPRHIKALVASLKASGVAIHSGRAILGFEASRARVMAVRTEEGTLPCDRVVVAAGAWSGGLLAGLGVQAPTPPVKGQIVLLGAGLPRIRRIIEHGKNYLVPRDDGRILIGATEEEAGFDTRTTSEGFSDLLAEAHRLCPNLVGAEVERSWAGLRPGSFDSKPYLGLAPGFENLFVAAGHKRAGLQLAPATAEVISDLVLGRVPRVDLNPYRIDREPGGLVDPTFRS
ncbi:glycine oxidase ThiO [Tundrisphaera lichenicola]|uniref:glycine oxidase ThiO n=1 Tax=Tundrisphaera lichenicola TaxID=2029860 RepID=UPI003EBF7000